MDSKTILQVFNEIDGWCKAEPCGLPLIVNTESYDVYKQLMERINLDTNKKVISVHEACPENGLPDQSAVIESVNHQIAPAVVLTGISQYVQLRGDAEMEKLVNTLIWLPVRGRVIILLEHCEKYLRGKMNPKTAHRIRLAEGDPSERPHICIASSREDAPDKHYDGIRGLLRYLENLTDKQVQQHPEVTVVTQYSVGLFSHALYPVSPAEGVFRMLQKKYPDMNGLIKDWGTDEQWKYLRGKLAELQKAKKTAALSTVLSAEFPGAELLSQQLGDVWESGDLDRQWLLWLGLKIYDAKLQPYLMLVLKNSQSVESFEEGIYLQILSVDRKEKNFAELFKGRAKLIAQMPENVQLNDLFCSRAIVRGRDMPWYLSAGNDREERLFFQCLHENDYSDKEITDMLRLGFPTLQQYLEPFSFTEQNLKPSQSAEQYARLTAYFRDYKKQKLINTIYPEFLEQVEAFALAHPYNSMQTRSMALKTIDKSDAQAYFFDALGVEYLGYMQAVCKKIDLAMDVRVARCNRLPSITVLNKEFENTFGNVRKISELDELKHHSQEIDYTQVKEPVHLLRELTIINRELRKMHSALVSGECARVIIVSDHGASRLAVIHESENGVIAVDEKGQHSGRCAPAASDPQIPFAEYESDTGYVVLGNYERFKGSRKANVEVHGGATLEEVLVPIITLSLKKAGAEISIPEPVLYLKGHKDPLLLTVFNTVPMHEPVLCVDEFVFTGTILNGGLCAQFDVAKLRKKGDYSAQLKDSGKLLSDGLQFTIDKKTKENDLF